MSKKAKRLNVNKRRLKKITIAIILIIIAIIAIFLIKSGLNSKSSNKTNLVINNNNVTSRLKQNLIIDNDSIYISIDDVRNFFDKYIEKDEKTGKIITTYEKKVASLEIGSSTIEINGSQKQIYASPKEENNTIYLPISEMGDVYNVEISNIKNSNTVTMDSLDREQIKAYTTKNVKVKAKAKILSNKIENVKKGNWVIYISDTDNGWAKVRTENGKIGYIKKNKLTNFVTVRGAMQEEKQIEGKVNLVWDYYSEYVSVPDRSGTTIDGVNVMSPSFFLIDSNGEFCENVGEKGVQYINWAKSNGYKVWPMVSNSGAGISVTSKVLNSYDSRQKLIENIVNMCVKYKLDGINMDFENMYEEDKDAYSRLIIELVPRMKEIGLITSVDVTAPDGSETWSLCFDRNVIGDVADYIIFMAYDQYGTSSKKAGTTAGYNWIETNLKKFIETEEIETDKIILGVPFYTRLWTENGEKVTSKTVDMKVIDEVIPSSAERVWDDTLKQDYIEYAEGNATKKMWVEDLKSIKEKVSLISKYQLGGVASWEKDRESDGTWEILKEALH